MEMFSVFYNALGYLGLVAAILWGLLFVGDGDHLPLMDAAQGISQQGVWIDVGLLLSVAVLHRAISRGLVHAGLQGFVPKSCARGTQAWVAGAALVVIYAFWQPLPKILWTTAESVQWVVLVLFYAGGTFIFIGLLSSHADFFRHAGEVSEAPRARSPKNSAGEANKSLAEVLGEPLHGGILIALWATSSMTVGHLLLASAFTAYSALDAGWSVWVSGTQGARDKLPLEGRRFLR